MQPIEIQAWFNINFLMSVYKVFFFFFSFKSPYLVLSRN